jgi:hypothetical protein
MTPPTRQKHITLTIVRWLALVLVGWLLYGLARALWSVIRLGAPLYDWQWYPGLIVLLIGLTVHGVWGLPHTKQTALAFAGLSIWVIIGYSGFWQTVELTPARTAPVPISFWTSGTSEIPDTTLEDIRSAGGRLYLIAGEKSLEGENRQALVAELERLSTYDIEVYLTSNVSDYLSVPVHDEWIVLVQREATFIRDESLTNIRGIVGDAECPIKSEMPFDILGLDRDAFFSTVRDYEDLIGKIKEKYPDLSLGVTADWTYYIDTLDGDADLSIVQRSPVDPPGTWDYMNAMIYSSYYPSSWRAYYVYSVERAMARCCPDCQRSYLIGVAGYSLDPLLDFDDLVRDAQLSRAMGTQEIVVFYLNGALRDFGDDFVRRLTTAVNGTDPGLTVQVPFSRPASLILYGITFADALLDVRSWKGLLLATGWIVASGAIALHSTPRSLSLRHNEQDHVS